MTRSEVPSDDEVVAALKKLGGRADAVTLCLELMTAKHPRQESQLAIQRAAERGRLSVNDDWTLSIAQEVAAAA